MNAMRTPKKGHGTAPSVAISTLSNIGRFENSPLQGGLKLRNSVRQARTPVRVYEARQMSKLFFVNIPYNCSDRELQEWVESRGIATRSIRIVRDLVAGVSPAFGYVELKDDSQIQEAISVLNGKRMRNQTILVKEAQVHGAGATVGVERRSA
jgi:RNA recognition motif-containing protein